MRIVSALLVAIILGAAAPALSAPSGTDKAKDAMQKGDFKTALNELRPLAAKNDPNAQFLLGMLYDSGKGVAQDQAVAAKLYRKAAEQKHLIAQLFLGVMLYSGQGVKKDYKEAARWLRAPAESGNDEAQFYLGSMYANGTGVKKDEAEAIRWLEKSAAQGNTRAMGLLASALFSRYSQSRNDKDLVDAYVWSHLAAEYDPVQATTSARVLIAKYCNEDQKKRGERAMAEWKKNWTNAKPSAR
jgi:TPR repeat protein